MEFYGGQKRIDFGLEENLEDIYVKVWLKL